MYSINAVIGVDGSPSCGVNKTCFSSLWAGEIGYEYGIEKKIKDLKIINAKGVFIEELEMLFAESNIRIKIIAIDESNPNSSSEYIIKHLEGEIK